MKQIDRRQFLTLALGAAGIAALGRIAPARAAISVVSHTPEEWKKLLTPAQFDVLRNAGTEAPFSSPLLAEHRAGRFVCVACALPLFSSAAKFDSGTGWPSFFDHLPEALQQKKDYALIVPRTEYHCARCGGHHGHVFDDGPPPTGLRYCNNGIALRFEPA